jgi:hypothetical protein
LFHGNDLLKQSQSLKNDLDLMRTVLAESFQPYVADISRDICRVFNDWNEVPRYPEANLSALISAFSTFVKKFSLPIKHIGKIELDKIPMFVNKKSKMKKYSSSNQSSRGHSFVENQFLSSKAVCCKCNQAFWGVGTQGLICQSKFILHSCEKRV